MEKELLSIGKLGRTHGLQGEMHARFDTFFLLRLKKLNAIFLEDKGKMLPFFVEELKLDEDGHAYLKLEEVKTREEAQWLVNREIYTERSNFKKTRLKDDLTRLLGFEVLEKNYGSLGPLENVFLMPAHGLGQCHVNGKEVLIPLNEETILQVNARKKTLEVELAQGLLDIYLK